MLTPSDGQEHILVSVSSDLKGVRSGSLDLEGAGSVSLDPSSECPVMSDPKGTNSASSDPSSSPDEGPYRPNNYGSESTSSGSNL